VLKESERYNFVLKAWTFLVFVGVTIHFGIWLVTVLERGEVALHCNFGGIFCVGAVLQKICRLLS
jgi:hypothetical protein